MKIVANITFGELKIDVYNTLDKPYFLASDVAHLINYSLSNTSEMLRVLEADEHLLVTIQLKGQKRKVRMINELGLYNILGQSRKPIARLWRRIVNQQLITLRKQKNMTIVDQFDEWDGLLDTLYFDEHTGVLMQSVTTQGGDVEQIPYDFDKEEPQ